MNLHFLKPLGLMSLKVSNEIRRTLECHSHNKHWVSTGVCDGINTISHCSGQSLPSPVAEATSKSSLRPHIPADVVIISHWNPCHFRFYLNWNILQISFCVCVYAQFLIGLLPGHKILPSTDFFDFVWFILVTIQVGHAPHSPLFYEVPHRGS